MPLYEYECQSCGRREEIIQRVGASPVGPCVECGGEMKKLISAPAFQFKGSGWYVTDYAKKGSAAGGESQPAETGASPKEPKKEKKEAASTAGAGKKDD